MFLRRLERKAIGAFTTTITTFLVKYDPGMKRAPCYNTVIIRVVPCTCIDCITLSAWMLFYTWRA